MGNLMNYAQRFVAVMLAIFGIIITIGGIALITDGKDDKEIAGHIALLVFLGILPMVAGVLWFRYLVKQQKAGIQRDMERIILNVATQAGGKVTPLEVARATELTMQEAKQYLDEMQRNGLINLFVTEEGNILYEIPGVRINDDERRGATEV